MHTRAESTARSTVDHARAARQPRLRSLRAILFIYALAPALILALVLSVLFALQQMHDRRDLLLSHGRASAEQLVELIYLSDGHPFEERIEWLNKSLMALMLERDMIRSVQLYRRDLNDAGDAELSLISSVGPTPRTQFSAEQLVGKPAHIYEDIHSLQVVHPLKGSTIHCWLAIELHRPYFLVGTYQIVLIGLLGMIACALAALVWAVFLSEKAAQSLARFRETLDAIGRGDFSARTTELRNLELHQLSTQINEMAARLTDNEREYQESLQQSMDDLRQSLDAMEEQNIELELAKKKAIETSQVKSTFLANTSHEIRTPLNGIIGFTNLLLKTEMDELQRDYLQTIQRSSESLLTTINDILDFSRIESGNLVLDHTPMNLGQVLEETLQILAPYAYEHQLDLVPFIDPQLPPSQIGDPLRIKQILTNLVSTAIRCSEKGSIPVRITVQSGKDAELVARICVTDIGNLAEEKTRRELRQLLKHRDIHQPQVSNNGMGLNIALRLIQSMRGDIGIIENEEGGLTYWFQIPLVIDRNRSAVTREQFPRCRIMLADPNPLTRQQIHQMLQQWRVEPLEHCDSATLLPALEQMWRHDGLPDAVIIDSGLWKDDFDAFVSSVQKLVDTCQCRVIIQGSPMDLRRCYDTLRTRVLAFVGKPVSRDGLLRALKRAIPNQSHTRPVTGGIPSLPWPARPRVLVVDDYEANRLLMNELLRAQNVETQTAASGEEALKLWRNQHFDMIFMDIQMPGMDGIETTNLIRAEETGRRTPVIALTAHVGTEEKSRLLSAGLDDYLSKPIGEVQLAHTIKRWMEINVQQGSAEPSPLEPRLVDISESLSLCNQDPKLARDLLQMLLRSLHEDTLQINQLTREKDYQGLFEIVHRVHGGCCYCGVPRLRAATSKLQEHLRPQLDNDTVDLDPALLEQVLKEIENLRDWAAEQDLEALFGHGNELTEPSD
ncbi:response regulator [Microbulbifer sp. SA54]|uniref:response regulator n=1 Tax=Microbulbifer sp. SA54 TaxID=3401577 RepID=UPI003AAED84E